MEKIFENKKRYKGFSLVEMILVVAISAIIALAVGQIFLTGMKTSERNKEMQKNLEEGRSAMEMMAKDIRMSKLTKGDSTNIFMYNNSQGKCISYQFDNTKKKLGVDRIYPDADVTDPNKLTCKTTATSYSYSDLTSVNITGNFFIPFETNRTTPPYSIGRATIRMTMGDGTDMEETLQTSISFRDYEDILQ
ncbi:MAG: prepilin-type N-terminal cleavage/methylation domain-containing protein [Parcubacteria group bacterium]|jgi:prepilin-type N-terminal cleavage/methylation domain-containing protein